jgi:low temperature requirement protein LtrA
MTLLSLVVTLIVVGLLLYVVEALLPIDATIKRIIHIVVIVVVLLWLLSIFVPGLDIPLRR